jgi:hypothetical protein
MVKWRRIIWRKGIDMRVVFGVVVAVVLAVILGLAYGTAPVAAQNSPCNPAVQQCS